MLEKMKQGEHAFDVNADIEPEVDDAPDYEDDFDADRHEAGLGDNGEEPNEHKAACARKSPEKR